MIKNLIINEIIPVSDGSTPIITNGRLFKGSELDKKIHNFFKRHIERSFDNQKMKNLRFSNFNSTLFNSSKALLGSNEGEETNEITFVNENETVTKKFAENIHKNVTNPFLFIVLTFAFEFSSEESSGNNVSSTENENISEEEVVATSENEIAATIAEEPLTKNETTENTIEDILCLIKMERFDGVQYTSQNFNIHPDMLPDYKTDLQKCAFIYKSKIVGLQESDFTNIDVVENPDLSNLDFHSKVLDRQDENISKYFMTSFLESYPIAKDGDVTRMVHKHTTAELAKYLSENCDSKQLDNFIENELQKRNRTSVSRIVEEVVNNSNMINHEKIESLNLDTDKISQSVFSNMRKENNSVYQEFVSTPDIIEKSSIKDIDNNGRDIRIYISKMFQTYGYATIDTTSSEEYVTIKLKKAKINLNLN